MVTDTTRRTLLKAALFGVATPMTVFASEGKTRSQPSLIGCALEGRDRYSVVVADHQGMPLSRLPLPERGHGIAINTLRQHAVAFARRPGSYLMVFDYVSGEMIRINNAASNRHFYGHGVYSNDGKHLFATEGERSSSRGIIGVYDVESDYQKVDELSGFGLGPHEVIIMPDGTLVIGVGGVHTDGRTPKNLDTMQPSLSYLSQTGILLEQHELPDRHLSIRHLAHDGDKTVLCGQQYRGEPDEYPALLAMHTAGGEIEPLQAEPEQWARFRHYIASIAASEEWIIATSPRGNCYGIWSKKSRQLVELAPLPDASGVVAKDGKFLISSGSGAVIAQSQPRDKSSVFTSIQWDNHWSIIS
ncbi:DUF1513 domain-containing protein [Vibrio fluminensis]|uniref:DUF1513 domain-containing protein n=1 Tax=Vibrio fluminensis TaxID=2783614 RepID=UPI00188950E0|nr:DUF1513 domain-containing protein [Vibrio fluminensis]